MEMKGKNKEREGTKEKKTTGKNQARQRSKKGESISIFLPEEEQRKGKIIRTEDGKKKRD